MQRHGCTGTAYQVLEPQEDVVGAGGNGHVGEEREGGGDGDTVVWDTGLAALEEDLGCLTVLGDTEEVARAGVQESVGRGRGRGQDDGVDDVVEATDAGALDGNDPGGGVGTWRMLVIDAVEMHLVDLPGLSESRSGSLELTRTPMAKDPRT